MSTTRIGGTPSLFIPPSSRRCLAGCSRNPAKVQVGKNTASTNDIAGLKLDGLTITPGYDKTITLNHTLEVRTLLMAAGTITSDTAELKLTGGGVNGSVMIGGTMSGTGTTRLANLASLDIQGTITLDERFLAVDSNTTVNWYDGTINANWGSRINVLGIFNAHADNRLEASDAESFNVGVGGQFRKVGGQPNGFTEIDIPFNVLGGGTSPPVATVSGHLKLLHGGFSSGKFSLSAGTSVVFDTPYATNDMIYYWEARTEILGPGVAVVDGSIRVSVNATIPVRNLNLPGGTIEGGGNLTIVTGGSLNWTGSIMKGDGTTTLNTGANATFGDPASFPDTPLQLFQRTFDNRGIVAVTKARLGVGDGGVIMNRAGAQFQITDDVSTLVPLTGTGRFENAGTFEKTGGTGNTFVDIPFTQTGGVTRIKSGWLWFRGVNNTFNLFGGLVTLDGGNARVAANFQHQGGTVEVNPGTFQVDGIYDHIGGDILMNWGTLTAAGGLDVGESALVSGNGTINADVDTSGTFLVGGEFGYGILNVNGDYTQLGGLTDVNGSLLDVAGELRIAAGPFTMRNWATLESDLGVWIDPGATVTGGGTVRGNLINAGLLTIGDALSPIMGLTVTGNYTQTAAGVLNLQARSSAPGDYDSIQVWGTANLGGTLNFSFLDGYTPFVGDVFSLLYYGTLNGTFATLNLPSSGAGTWDPRYNDPVNTFSLWVVDEE